MPGVRRAVAAAGSADGLAVAYLMAVVNAALVCIAAFGAALTADQTAAVMGLANAGLVAVFYLLHYQRQQNGAAA